MKFSIIGTGFILPAHVQAIRDVGGEIIDIVNNCHREDSWKNMVQSTKADCIVVLTPNYLHCEIIRESTKNGKIVLCEKPLTINSRDCEELIGIKNIFGVLQLRYHPLLKDIRENIKENGNVINMDISVYRDQKYYEGWKGQKEKSGGVLFNLGVHYFDLLLYLFGEPTEIKTEYLDEKTGRGIIKGENYICNWQVSTDAKKENQKRIFEINGTNYNFSSKDNLSFENLHKFVYEDLLNGKGVGPKEALKSIELIEKLHENYYLSSRAL
ncbi:MAG: Gfo/Idh/MocA family oxidoreductase [Candidatus Staskawiczbacteria bacterium]|nr:Gfo/Idh/MocA family oxidoreductase [Candidatus Staskawiczbacteria bacterium]